MIEALPLALGIALSPFPVIPAILLLFTQRPLASGAGFLLGWLVGVGVATGVAIAVTDLVDATNAPRTWVSWARVVLGLLLVGYGAVQWRGRGSGDGELPGWMSSLQEATPTRARWMGVVLSLANPKIVLLAFSGGLVIGASASTLTAEVVGGAVFTVVASVTVAAPLAAYLLAGQRVLEPLGKAREWLQRNNDAVMAVVLAVLGVLLVVKGVRGL